MSRARLRVRVQGTTHDQQQHQEWAELRGLAGVMFDTALHEVGLLFEAGAVGDVHVFVEGEKIGAKNVVDRRLFVAKARELLAPLKLPSLVIAPRSS